MPKVEEVSARVEGAGGAAGSGRELVRHRGPWRSIDDLEFAVAEYIDWFNHRRLHSSIGMIPPVEAEQHHYDSHQAPATQRERVNASL